MIDMEMPKKCEDCDFLTTMRDCDDAFDICYLTPMQIKDVVVRWEKIRNSPK